MSELGVIFYRGPSLLTGDPIIGILTGLDRGSQNHKTGPMAQAWLLRADLPPMEAKRQNLDDAASPRCAQECPTCWKLCAQQLEIEKKAAEHRYTSLLGKIQGLGAYQLHGCHGGDVEAESEREVIDGEAVKWVKWADLQQAITEEP